MDILFYSYTLLLGAFLSYYDIKSQEYPLIIWLAGTLLLLPFFPTNITFVILCLTGLLACFKNINIGAGDFFYLATLALGLSLTRLLWLVQFASLFGIAFYLLKLNKQKTIAFLPFLVAGYVFVLLGTRTGFF